MTLQCLHIPLVPECQHPPSYGSEGVDCNNLYLQQLVPRRPYLDLSFSNSLEWTERDPAFFGSSILFDVDTNILTLSKALKLRDENNVKERGSYYSYLQCT